MAFPLLRGASSGVTARPPSPAGPSFFPAAALHFRVLLKECDAVVFVGRHSPASFLGKSYHKVLRHCNRGKNTVCLSEAGSRKFIRLIELYGTPTVNILDRSNKNAPKSHFGSSEFLLTVVYICDILKLQLIRRQLE